MIIKKIKKNVIEALDESHRVYSKLGESGIEELEQNQFGNKVLKMDLECEKVIIECLKKNNVPVRIYSEEHGIVDVVDNPRYLAILDGLDGSYRFRDDYKNARSGTIFGIFDGLNPNYDDYLVSGFYEHVNDKLYFVEKDKGSFVRKNNLEEKLQVSGVEVLNSQAKIYSDLYWDFNREYYKKIIENYGVDDSAIAGVYYSDLASGKYDLVLRCSGKQNLEMMGMYGLVKEAGGFVVDLKGDDIGVRKYLEFGQDEEKKEVMIAAASEDLIISVLDYLR